MFCINCGQELPDGAKFCPACGTGVPGTPAPAGDPAPEREKEVVIKEGLCNRVKGKFNVQNGHGLLTNKRFIYSKHSLAKIATMGVLVNLTKGSYDFEIPLSEIKEMSEGRQGFSKTTVFTTVSGDRYEFYFTDRERWLIEFGNLI